MGGSGWTLVGLRILSRWVPSHISDGPQKKKSSLAAEPIDHHTVRHSQNFTPLISLVVSQECGCSIRIHGTHQSREQERSGLVSSGLVRASVLGAMGAREEGGAAEKRSRGFLQLLRGA